MKKSPRIENYWPLSCFKVEPSDLLVVVDSFIIPVFVCNPQASTLNVIEGLKGSSTWSIPDIPVWFSREVFSNSKGSEQKLRLNLFNVGDYKAGKLWVSPSTRKGN